MTPQELSEQFFNISCEIKTKCTSSLNKEQLSRAIFSRLYYALYHKYLAHDSTLKDAHYGKKHEIIQDSLSRDNYPHKIKQIYKKMYKLRLWADYDKDIDKDLINEDIGRYVYDTESVIKMGKLK